MRDDGELQAMREALEAALQSHSNLGKARMCDCSLCLQMREALKKGAGGRYTDRVREECAGIADWKVGQLNAELAKLKGDESASLRLAVKVAREIADRIRVLKSGL